MILRTIIEPRTTLADYYETRWKYEPKIIMSEGTMSLTKCPPSKWRSIFQFSSDFDDISKYCEERRKTTYRKQFESFASNYTFNKKQ